MSKGNLKFENMALGKGLNSLIPPKGTRINIKAKSVEGDEADVGFTTKSIGGDEPRVVKDVKNIKDDIIEAEPVGRKGTLEVEIDKIKKNSKQPRKEFDQTKIKELSESIGIYGIIEPLVVSDEGGGEYELIAGERRLKAARMAGLSKVPVTIRGVDDQERLEISLIENIQRENLNPIETAMAYKELMDEFGLSVEKVAQRVGKSRPKISNTMRLLSLPSEIQSALSSGAISEGHAIYLLGIDSPVKQMEMFRKITMNSWTVAETAKQVKKAGAAKNAQVKINMGDEDKQRRLEGYFGTKVEIKRARKGGKIIIEFYSDEELDGIMGRLK